MDEPTKNPNEESKRNPIEDSNFASRSTAQPPKDRSWLWIGLAFLAFWVVYLNFFGPRNRRPLEESGIDRPADYNWSLEDLQGQPVNFSQFKGKTVFLNVWATWCPPCVGEMPSIARLAANPEFQGKDIVFVCVSVDDSIDAVKRFMTDKKWPMTILHASSLPPVFSTEGIPATFILDPSGRIVAAEVGASEWDNPDVVAFLKKAASGAARPAT